MSRVSCILLSSLLLSTAACAPGASDDAPRVGVVRQAVTTFTNAPDPTPAMGSGWGTLLAPCGEGYVVAGTGAGAVALGPVDPSPLLGAPSTSSRAIGCLPKGAGQPPAVIMGTDGGASLLQSDGGWALLVGGDVSSLAVPPPDSGYPLVVGQASGRLLLITGLASGQVIVSFDAGVGTPSVAWHPSEPLLAVGMPRSREVAVWRYAPTTPMLTPFVSLPVSLPGFGRTVAWGNVDPQGGVELLVGSEGAVDVYALVGNPLDSIRTLSPAGPSATFGSAIAVQRGSGYGNLDYAWVGDPGTSTVYRFLGERSDSFGPNSGGADGFGTALTSWAPNAVSVGAPGTNGGSGAVYTRRENAGTMPGAVEVCEPTTTCFTPACNPGLCIGRVFCKTDGTAGTPCDGGLQCNVDGVCGTFLQDGGFAPAGTEPDAGTAPDAGTTPDAGLGRDAGSVDAGPHDGGVTTDGGDAGPIVFQTCGCSGGPLAPALLLGLALLRRRR